MALTRAYTTNFASVEKIDDYTVAINTKVVESLFPYQMSYLLMVSRCRAEALKYDWNAMPSTRRAPGRSEPIGTWRTSGSSCCRTGGV